MSENELNSHREFCRSISFSGSGFLATYQLGVAQCFLSQTPWILRTAPCVLGASAGSLVAAAVVCEMSFVDILDEMTNFTKQMRMFILGPLNPAINVFRWLEHLLQKHLPPDAHQLSNGRLAVAMTRMTDGKHTVMSEFQSKKDVVQALLCSCFVPGYCGISPPSFNGVYYIDGGFSRMQPFPTAPPIDTLTVSPFSGETDICPKDTPSSWDMVVTGSTLKGNMANSRRIINALYPFTAETLEQAFHSGYKDALYFLQSNDLVPSSMMKNISLGQQNHFKNSILVILENKDGQEMKRKAVTPEMMTVTAASSCSQTDTSTEDELTSTLATNTPLLRIDSLQSALLCNMMCYLSMLGLAIRIFSYVLLPITLCVFYILKKRHRLKFWYLETLQLLFWAWHGIRQFTVFFFSIFVNSIEKNIKDKVIPLILLLQWLKLGAEKTGSTRHNHLKPYTKLFSISLVDAIREAGVWRRLLTIKPFTDKKHENSEEESTYTSGSSLRTD